MVAEKKAEDRWKEKEGRRNYFVVGGRWCGFGGRMILLCEGVIVGEGNESWGWILKDMLLMMEILDLELVKGWKRREREQEKFLCRGADLVGNLQIR